MTCRWKKQTVMFVFVMAAMTSTIFGMKDKNDSPKQKYSPKKLKCMLSSSSSEEIDGIEQNQKIQDLKNEDDFVTVYGGDEKIGNQPKRHKTEKPKEYLPQEGEQPQVKMEDQIKVKEVEVTENDDVKQLNAVKNDSANQKPAPLSKDENKANYKPEYHNVRRPKIRRPNQSEMVPIKVSNAAPVQVKHVKPENLFATFLEADASAKYALVHSKNKNFIDRVPLQALYDLNNELDYHEKTRAAEAGIYWNPNALNVVMMHFGALNNRQLDRNIETFENEKLKLANDVFSRIPNTESPADYDFYFDLTDEGKKWSILALHKQKQKYIGRQWKYVGSTKYTIDDFDPCDLQKRWIYSENSTDEINKILLTSGFNFAPLLNTKEKNQDEREKKQAPVLLDGRNRFVWDGKNEWDGEKCLDRANVDKKYEWDGEKRLYRADLEVAKNKKLEQYNNNLQYALCQKLETSNNDKSAKYLMSSHNYMKANAPSDSYFDENYFDSLFHSQTALESWKPFYVVVNDEDVLKAFHNNLFESFEFMMKYRNWPKELWSQVLDSERPQSNEMMKVLLDHIKESAKESHLSMLLHVNDNGRMTLFNKAMHLFKENEKSATILKKSLTIFSREVRTPVYQYLLFFGVVTGERSLCEFAKEKGYGVSLQQKATLEIANALASKYCRCGKEKKIYKMKQECTGESMNNSKKENQIEFEGKKEIDETNNKECLHSTLAGKTALEIVTKLSNDGVEGSRSNRNQFKGVKIYLEGEAKNNKTKKDKTKKEKIEVVIDDSDDDFKTNKRKREDINKKR